MKKLLVILLALSLSATAWADGFNSTFGGSQVNQVLVAPGPIGSVTPNTITGTTFQGTQYNLGNTLLFSSTAPTLGTGWGTSPSIIASGSPTFRINVGTGTTASSGVINMPAAANGWNAIIQVFKPAGTSSPLQTTYVSGSTTTSISVYNLSNSNGSSVAWPAGTVLIILAEAY